MADACEGGDGSVGGDSGTDAPAGSVACVCLGADRLIEVIAVRWLTHAREVTEGSETTTVVDETGWLAPLLVSVSVQTDPWK